MRSLRIEKGGKIFLDNSPVDFSQLENKSSFLSSILSLDLGVSSDLTVSDVIHFLYDSREIIRDMFSVEYEAVRAVITSSKLPIDHKCIRVYKSFCIEKEDDGEFVYLMPGVELIPCEQGENGLRNIGELPIVIDESIILNYDNPDTGDKKDISTKTKITLLDLVECIFEDLNNMVVDGLILID